MDRFGYCTSLTVRTAQQALEEFCGNNLTIYAECVKIATINAYRDMSWAINRYKIQHKDAMVTTTPTNTIAKTVRSTMF